MNRLHNDNIPTMAFQRVVKFNSPTGNYSESSRRLDETHKKNLETKVRSAIIKII